MRKTLALLSLSLGITLINPLWSAVAQIPTSLPPLPIPTNPGVSPLPIPINPVPEVQPPLKLIEMGTDCTPQKRLFGVG